MLHEYGESEVEIVLDNCGERSGRLPVLKQFRLGNRLTVQTEVQADDRVRLPVVKREELFLERRPESRQVS